MGLGFRVWGLGFRVAGGGTIPLGGGRGAIDTATRHHICGGMRRALVSKVPAFEVRLLSSSLGAGQVDAPWTPVSSRCWLLRAC